MKKELSRILLALSITTLSINAMEQSSVIKDEGYFKGLANQNNRVSNWAPEDQYAFWKLYPNDLPSYVNRVDWGQFIANNKRAFQQKLEEEKRVAKSKIAVNSGSKLGAYQQELAKQKSTSQKENSQIESGQHLAQYQKAINNNDKESNQISQELQIGQDNVKELKNKYLAQLKVMQNKMQDVNNNIQQTSAQNTIQAQEDMKNLKDAFNNIQVNNEQENSNNVVNNEEDQHIVVLKQQIALLSQQLAPQQQLLIDAQQAAEAATQSREKSEQQKISAEAELKAAEMNKKEAEECETQANFFKEVADGLVKSTHLSLEEIPQGIQQDFEKTQNDKSFKEADEPTKVKMIYAYLIQKKQEEAKLNHDQAIQKQQAAQQNYQQAEQYRQDAENNLAAAQHKEQEAQNKLEEVKVAFNKLTSDMNALIEQASNMQN